MKTSLLTLFALLVPLVSPTPILAQSTTSTVETTSHQLTTKTETNPTTIPQTSYTTSTLPSTAQPLPSIEATTSIFHYPSPSQNSDVTSATTTSEPFTVVEEKASLSSFTIVPLFRLYHPSLKVHLYTKDRNEYAVLAKRGWKQEGMAWNTSGQQGQTVYRLYHPLLRVHLYTKDTNEYAVLATRGWKQEESAFRSHGDTPIYRLYHPGLKVHLYTRDHNEYTVLSKRGWKQEGIAFYATTTVVTIQQFPHLGQEKVDFLNYIYQGSLESWTSHGILPSISAAQAILESSWGTSTLGRSPNHNLFGIKVSPDWTGGQVVMSTQEFVNGQFVTIKAAFRTYPSWSASIKDHAAFFTSTAWRKERYKDVVGQKDYKLAAAALQAAGYATDPQYSTKLISIIERYHLYQWDQHILP